MVLNAGMSVATETWISVSAENLVRHRSGTCFLQAKIGGKKIRKNLGTDNLRQAKTDRDVGWRSCAGKTRLATEAIRQRENYLRVLG